MRNPEIYGNSSSSLQINITHMKHNNLSIGTDFLNWMFLRNTIFEHGIKIWNNLSPYIKLIKNKIKLKKVAKYNLINNTNS